MTKYRVRWLLHVWKSLEIEAESEQDALEKFNPNDPTAVEVESEVGDYMEAIEIS